MLPTALHFLIRLYTLGESLILILQITRSIEKQFHDLMPAQRKECKGQPFLIGKFHFKHPGSHFLNHTPHLSARQPSLRKINQQNDEIEFGDFGQSIGYASAISFAFSLNQSTFSSQW